MDPPGPPSDRPSRSPTETVRRMRRSFLASVAVAVVSSVLLAAGASHAAESASAKPAAPAKSAVPTVTAAPPAASNTVPADVRARVVAKLHGATPNDVAPSPIPGLYEVTMGG